MICQRWRGWAEQTCISLVPLVSFHGNAFSHPYTYTVCSSYLHCSSSIKHMWFKWTLWKSRLLILSFMWTCMQHRVIMWLPIVEHKHQTLRKWSCSSVFHGSEVRATIYTAIVQQYNLAVILRLSHSPIMNKSAEAKITTAVVIWNNHFHEFMFREMHQWAQGQRVQLGLEWRWRGAPGGRSWNSSTVAQCLPAVGTCLITDSGREVLRSISLVNVLQQRFRKTPLQASFPASKM